MDETLILGWLGRMGSGKTLSMSVWAQIFYNLTGKQIWSNYHLANARFFKDFKDLENEENIIVCYDEIHIDFDSRDWDNKKRQQFTHWFTQIRKRRIIFLYTTQNVDALEKRVRRQTSYLFICRKHYQYNYLHQDIYDTQLGLENATFLRRMTYKQPQLFYGLYNTHEVIKQGFYKEEEEEKNIYERKRR